MTKPKRSDPEKPGLQFKAFEFDTKAVPDEPDADGMVFVPAYGSVFDVIDSHGDMTVKGTFAETLAEWEEKGAPIPAHFNHSMFSNDPMDNIGFLSEAGEDEKGLKLLVGLDVGHNPKAAYAHRLIKQKRLRELSIGYIKKSWEYVKKDGATSDWDTYRKLTAVDLLEVSFVSVASNRQSTVLEKTAALLYGAADDDVDAKGDTDADATVAGNLAAAATALAAAAKSLASLSKSDVDDEGEDETSGDAKSASTDDSGHPVEVKSLSARARAALAMSAVLAAETE